MRKSPKKIYKKAKPKEFPNNSRSIPEFFKSINEEIYLLIGLFCIIVAIITIQADLYNNLKETRRIEAEKGRVNNEITHWEEKIKEYPSYRDGYFSLALLYYQRKNFDMAEKNLEKAMVLDPNFEKGRELERLINSRSN